jgi:hypothetical protein
VSPRATVEEVRKAYRKKARKVHPDVDKTPGADQRFMEVKAAHDEMMRRIEQGERPSEPSQPRAGAPEWVHAQEEREREAFRREWERLWEELHEANRQPSWIDTWRPVLYVSAGMIWLGVLAAMFGALRDVAGAGLLDRPGRPPVEKGSEPHHP